MTAELERPPLKTNERVNEKEPHTVSAELAFQFDARLISHHLGQYKYHTSCQAIGELVANSFDANAQRVDISVARSELDGFQSLTVSDDGDGISREDLRSRFMRVGVAPDRRRRFGNFGVGRLSVHRIGSVSEWTSVSVDNDSQAWLITFRLKAEASDKLFDLREEPILPPYQRGTKVRILNIRDASPESLAKRSIVEELLNQFCSFLLANTHRSIWIDGEALEASAIVDSQQLEEICENEEVPSATINHLLLKKSTQNSRLEGNIHFVADGRTVESEKPESDIAPNYVALVECPALDAIVAADRNGIIQMNSTFANLRAEVQKRIAHFNEAHFREKRSGFIQRARLEDFYPFKGEPADPLSNFRQMYYDVVLTELNDQVYLDRLSKRQQAVIFGLVERLLGSESLLKILEELAKLPSADIERLKTVLERATLKSVIQLSDEVSGRLHFLAALEAAVYEKSNKRLKERSQLHKMLEPHCWLFGPQFHLATSDKSFMTLLRAHRAELGMPNAWDGDEAASYPSLDDIPDLFLSARKSSTYCPKTRHLVVEIKRPLVKIGEKELQQLKRYAHTIRKHPGFDTSETAWDLFLVSSEVDEDIDSERSSKDGDFGFIAKFDAGITLWVFRWSELIERARQEMHLVREHLRLNVDEDSAKRYLRKEFPQIFGADSEP